MDLILFKDVCGMEKKKSKSKQPRKLSTEVIKVVDNYYHILSVLLIN